MAVGNLYNHGADVFSERAANQYQPQQNIQQPNVLQSQQSAYSALDMSNLASTLPNAPREAPQSQAPYNSSYLYQQMDFSTTFPGQQHILPPSTLPQMGHQNQFQPHSNDPYQSNSQGNIVQQPRSYPAQTTDPLAMLIPTFSPNRSINQAFPGQIFHNRGITRLPPGARGPMSNITPQSLPPATRGPPRKPKQSEFSLWVGSLPPGVNIEDVKEHFSRDARDDILSVFLMRTNSAFVNYQSREATVEAVKRFDGSLMSGANVPLRCKVRDTAADRQRPVATMASTQSAVDAITQNRAMSARATAAAQPYSTIERPGDKFFILKSLTREDLHTSVRDGVWATQPHNEEGLNHAFRTAQNVYLIFSANKSGEYFGYARMESEIAAEAPRSLTWTPRTNTQENEAYPKRIFTPATEHAPAGYITDDTARGSLFWEATAPSEEPQIEAPSPITEDGVGEKPAAGKPFKVSWRSTQPLPFFRVRFLRNPWNQNREIKIARDGTEIEPSVGATLINMFHELEAPPQAPPLGLQGGMHGVYGPQY